MTDVDVSIVLTAFNEAAHIRETIQALDVQTGLGGGFEILLVDDRSTDATVAEAEAAGSTRLRILHAAPVGDSILTTRQQALDMAFTAAAGRVVLTVDADSAMPEDWASKMAAPILSGEADAVAGPIGFQPLDSWLPRWQTSDAAYYFLISSLLNRLGASGGVFFGNFGFLRRLYAETGGFEAIGYSLTEDLAFAQTLFRAGAKFRFPSRGVRVDVRAAPGFSALVARTMRISSGSFSVLAVVLTIWPLSFLALVIAAAFFPGALMAMLLIGRIAAGALIVGIALRHHENRRLHWFAPLYEPVVLILSGAVLRRMIKRDSIGWGGHKYER